MAFPFTKIKADFKSLIAKQQDEIERLKRKLETGSENSATVEGALREEVEKLKAIISDLEERLGKPVNVDPWEMCVDLYITVSIDCWDWAACVIFSWIKDRLN